MAFVTGEGSDSFVTHSFDSAPSPGPQTPCSESASSSPACPRHERFPLSRSPALPLSRSPVSTDTTLTDFPPLANALLIGGGGGNDEAWPDVSLMEKSHAA